MNSIFMVFRWKNEETGQINLWLCLTEFLCRIQLGDSKICLRITVGSLLLVERTVVDSCLRR